MVQLGGQFNILNDTMAAPKARPVVSDNRPSQSLNSSQSKAEPTFADNLQAKTSESTDESKTSEVHYQTNKTETPSREKAMRIFLEKMESELGISQDEVLEAFSEMSVTDLMRPPEETVAALIEKLDLSSQEKGRATELYSDMLAVTAMAGMSKQLAETGAKAEIHVVDKEEARLKNLRQSIDDLSDKFFMTGNHVPVRSGVERQDQIIKAYEVQKGLALSPSDKRSELSPENFIPNQNYFETELGQGQPTRTEGQDISQLGMQTTEELFTGLKAQNLAVPEKASTYNNVASASNEPVANSQNQNMFTQLQESLKGLNQALGTEVEVSEAADYKVMSGDAQPIQSTDSGLEGLPVQMNTRGQEDNSFDSEGEESSGEGADATILNTADSQSLKSARSKEGFAMGVPQPTSLDIKGNVQELITQAQFLSKKGGGEMKISLNPEGLGEVNLKVTSVGDQVNVEMIASNNEAKKMLEKGLGDLKESLAAHKLNLDTIKIDSSKDISQFLDQQKHDQESGYQQRFLNDFRHKNDGFRRDMFEFGAPSKPEAQGRDQAAQVMYAGKKRTDGSRRLDLVA